MSLPSIDDDGVTLDVIGIGSKERVNAIGNFGSAISLKEELRGEASAVAWVAERFCDDDWMFDCACVLCDAEFAKGEIKNIFHYVLSYKEAVLVGIACFGLGFGIHIGVGPYQEDICRLLAVSVL